MDNLENDFGQEVVLDDVEVSLSEDYMKAHDNQQLRSYEISDAVKANYYAYADSVIRERALVLAKDGLKSGQRRILYVMNDIAKPDKPTVKSARVVGDVIGKYHPHGDSSTYGALVNMTHDFYLHLPLIIGQGHFGSSDGDEAAAMRYCFVADTNIMTSRGMKSITSMVDKSVLDLSHNGDFNQKIYQVGLNKKLDDALLQADCDINKLNKRFTLSEVLDILLEKGIDLTFDLGNEYGVFESQIDVDVLSLNGYNNAYKWVYSGKHPTYHVKTRNGYEVECTLNEPFLKRKMNEFGEMVYVFEPLFNLDLGDTIALNGQVIDVEGDGVNEFVIKNRKMDIEEVGTVLFYTQLNKLKESQEQFDLKNAFKDDMSITHLGLIANKMKASFTTWNDLDSFGEGHFFDGLFDFAKDVSVEDVLSTLNGLSSKQFKSLMNGYVNNSYWVYLNNHYFKTSGLICFVDDEVGKFLKLMLINHWGILTSAMFDEDEWKIKELNNLLSDLNEQEISYENYENNFVFEPVESIETNDDVLSDDIFASTNVSLSNLKCMKVFDLDKYDALLNGKEYVSKNNFNDDEIVEIEASGLIKPVYDISVANVHCFVANGIFAHNTECKLSHVAYHGLFADIKNDTVDFVENYDGTLLEPICLPARFPNLWVNGTQGIAVGVSSHIPPHNLKETTNAILAYMDNPDISFTEIAEIMPAPDFPTGGLVSNLKGYLSALETGLGSVDICSHYRVEDGLGNVVMDSKNPDVAIAYQNKKLTGDKVKLKQRVLIVYELPYEVKKKEIVDEIIMYLRDKKESSKLNEWISNFAEESDNQEEVRLAFYLKPNINPELVFRHLCRVKKFKFQQSYNYIFRALNDQYQPLIYNIKMYFDDFIDLRRDVITRRTQKTIREKEARAHILNGLTVVLKGIDQAIDMIKQSDSVQDALNKLQTHYNIDEIQAQAVLDIRLQKLTSMEMDKIHVELNDVNNTIADCKDLLVNQDRLKETIKQDLIEFTEQYGKPRNSLYVNQMQSFTEADYVKKEDVIVIMTKDGYIKRMPQNSISTQNKNGKGKSSIDMYEGDTLQNLIYANSHDYLMYFTKNGSAYINKAYELPEGNTGYRGKHIANLFEDWEDDEIVSILNVSDFNDEQSVMIVTEQGKVKRTLLSKYQSRNKNKLIAIKLENDNKVCSAMLCQEHDQIMIFTSNNVVNRFVVAETKTSERKTVGIDGVKLSNDEKVVDAIIIQVEPEQIKYETVVRTYIDRFSNNDNEEKTKEEQQIDNSEIDKDKFLFIIAENGIGKKTPLSEFKLQKRKAKGIKFFKENDKTGKLVKSHIVTNENEIILSTEQKTMRVKVSEISSLSRNASGSSIMNTNNDTIVDIEIV